MSQHFGFTSEPSQPLDFTSSGLPSLPNSAFSSHYLFPLPVPPQSAFATTSIDAFCFNTSIIPYHSQSHQDNILVSPASPSSQESELEEDCSSMSSAHLLPLGDPSLMQAYSQSTCSQSSTDIDSDPSQPMPGSPSSSDDSSSCLDGLPSFELGMPPPLPGTTILERSASATSMSSLPPLPIPFTSLTVDGAGRTSRDLSPPSYSNSFSSFSTPYVSTTNSLPLPYTPSTAYVPVMPAVVTPTPQAPTATASPAPNPFHPYSTRQKKRERPQPEAEIHEVQKTQPVSSRPLSKSSSHRAEAKRPAPSSPDGFPALCPFVEINDGVGVSGFNGPCPLNDYFVSLSHREWATMDENASQSRRSAKCRMRVTITVPPSASQPGAELTLALCLNHGGGAAAKDRKYDAAFLTLPTVGPNGQPSYAVIRSRPEKRRSVWIVSASEANKFKHTVPSAMSLDQRGEYGLWFYNLPEGVEDYQVEVEVGTIAGCRARELAVDQNPSKKQKPSKSRS